MSAKLIVTSLGPSIALIAALSVGYDRSQTIWEAGVPWVVGPFQQVAVTASGIGLALLVIVACVPAARPLALPSWWRASPSNPRVKGVDPRRGLRSVGQGVGRLGGGGACLLPPGGNGQETSSPTQPLCHSLPYGATLGDLPRPPHRTVIIAGIILLACLGLSAIGADAPLLSLARTAEVGLGLLAYAAVARRPDLARWLLIGFGCLVLLQLPIVALQEATQSTFPEGHFIYGWGRDYPAVSPGSAVLFGAHGALWLRAEGSFPHPNVIGGFLAIFIVLGVPWIERALTPGRQDPVPGSHRGPDRRALPLLTGSWTPTAAVLLSVWAIAWIELVFTFSRAALLAAFVGCGVWGIEKLRTKHGRRLVAVLAIPPTLALALGVAAAGPFLLARVDPTPAQLQSAPVAGRLLLDRVAFRLIAAHPLLGVGAGNFVVVEALPPFNGIAVDPVHVVPLLVAAEAGIPAGLAWLAIVLGGPVEDWWRQRQSARVRPGSGGERCAPHLAHPLTLAALPLAILTLALLDHYLWSLAPGRSLFWLALAIWAATGRGLTPPSRAPLSIGDGEGTKRFAALRAAPSPSPSEMERGRGGEATAIPAWSGARSLPRDLLFVRQFVRRWWRHE